MAAELMKGTELAREVISRSAARAAELAASTGIRPCLATVIVGDDPASVTYVRMKENRCRRAGISSRHVALPAELGTAGLVSVISGVSADPRVHGILLQHPVPPQIDERAAFEAIAPGKDVDGVTMHSFAAMAFGYPGFASCTPARSCGCSMLTAWTRPGNTPWCWAAARSWASRPACCCSAATPR
jgi:methylenetetrahydrofolate dehydrogenase (NADP+) / methenyltetrahydrofolate cyclohydrolase